MRRRRLLLLLAALGLGGGGYWATTEPQIPTTEQAPSPTEPPGTDTATATPTATPTPSPEHAETAVYGGKSLTVAAPETARKLEFDDRTDTAESGAVFLTLKLTAKNVSDQPLNIPWPFAVRTEETETDVRGQFGNDSPERIESPERRLYGPSTIFWPDVTHEGWVYVQVPAATSAVTFVWFYASGVREEEDREITYRVPVPE